jgi:hypothetical protein
MKAMLDVIESLLLSIVGLIAAIILGDTALRFFGGREENPIVGWFHRTAETLTPLPALDVFPDQQYWQTAILALILWALAAAFLVFLFRALRQGVDRLEQQRSESTAAS